MATLLPQVCSLVDICSNLQFSSINIHARKQKQNISRSHRTTLNYACTAFENKRYRQSPVRSSLVVIPQEEELSLPSEKKVYDVILKQAALVKRNTTSTALNFRPDLPLPGMSPLLTEAYHRSGMISEAYAKTFHLGTLLLTPEKRRAIWAIGVWCRRTDDLVDGPNALYTTHLGLERWESKLYDIFAGRPYDMFDAALCDTIARFPLDIRLFKDLIEGMRMDLQKSRYENFDELYLYSYYASGTVGMITLSVMGIAPESKATTESIYSAAVSLGVALQLTNVLRDVGEDARRGRIYLPQDELAQAGLSDEDIFKGKVTDRWRDFMKNQIKRARMFYKKTEKGLTEYSPDGRWPIWSIFLMYRQILDEIEANDYNSFTKKACVSTAKKLFLGLPVAYGRSLMPPASIKEAN